MFRIRCTVLILFIIGLTLDNINCDSVVSKEDGNTSLREIELKIGDETVNRNSSYEARIRTKRRIKYERIRTPSGRSVSITSPMFRRAKCGTKAKLINLDRQGVMVRHDYNLVAGEFDSMWTDRNKCFGNVKIKKIINGCLWNLYKSIRQDIRLELNSTDVNEQLLFFGTHRASPYTRTGFDERRSSGGSYGAGIYFTPLSSNADDHAANNKCPLCTRTMFLCRVILGKEYKAYQSVYQAHAPIGHHSVVGMSLAGDDYVVYRGEQIYPEYEISYKVETCKPVITPKPPTTPQPRRIYSIFDFFM